MDLRDCDFHVFRVNYTIDVKHYKPGMDSDVSHVERNVKCSALVIAPTAPLALVLFEFRSGEHSTLDRVELVGPVHSMMRI